LLFELLASSLSSVLAKSLVGLISMTFITDIALLLVFKVPQLCMILQSVGCTGALQSTQKYSGWQCNNGDNNEFPPEEHGVCATTFVFFFVHTSLSLHKTHESERPGKPLTKAPCAYLKVNGLDLCSMGLRFGCSSFLSSFNILSFPDLCHFILPGTHSDSKFQNFQDNGHDVEIRKQAHLKD
jgi:hypothetical protein